MSLNVPLLRQSFAHLCEVEPQLMQRFYDHLFARYPQTRHLFGRNSRPQQEKMLAQALAAVLDHIEDAPWLQSTLGGLGAKHVAYGVTDDMYAWVGDALIVTLAEAAGPLWNAELERAWVDAYNAIAGMMLAGAREARRQAA